MIPIAIALLVTAFPASAKYSEQWMTNSEITHAQSSTATARSDKSARKAPLRAAATTADDVDGWDSLSHVQLMVAVERAFNIRFATAELTGLANVGELADVIDRRRAAA